MAFTNQLKNQHLLWRAGFGPMAEDLGQLSHISQQALYKTLLQASSKEPKPIQVVDQALQDMMMTGAEARIQKKELSKEEREELRKKSQEELKTLNITWLNEMINSDAQLREKMSLFWHGHFASKNLNIIYQQELLNIIRRHALGSFRDLLHQVSKSAAMIYFLNNNQNNKNHPNENFAREVMELFTMGRGHYTEMDVKEGARAFTGWSASLDGTFIFRKGQHDDLEKTILGQTGPFDGDAVLDILLSQKQTARYITGKIYRYLVNDNIDTQRVEELADRFFQSDYDISRLLEDIFTSDWFYKPKNIGTKIKSPIDLLVGMRRMLPMTMANEQSQILAQSIMGQILFNPPNVSGWPSGSNWIDSSTLMFRLHLPKVIFDSDVIQVTPKDDDDLMMGMRNRSEGDTRVKGYGKIQGGQDPGVHVQWDTYFRQFEKTPREQLIASLKAGLLQTPLGCSDDTLSKYIDARTRESFIKTTTLQLMSTPEYQLC